MKAQNWAQIETSTVLEPLRFNDLSWRWHHLISELLSFTHPWLHNPSEPSRLSFFLLSDRERSDLIFSLLIFPSVSLIPPPISLPAICHAPPPLHRNQCVSNIWIFLTFHLKITIWVLCYLSFCFRSGIGAWIVSCIDSIWLSGRHNH
jgi:hypothetical protein